MDHPSSNWIIKMYLKDTDSENLMSSSWCRGGGGGGARRLSTVSGSTYYTKVGYRLTIQSWPN